MRTKNIVEQKSAGSSGDRLEGNVGAIGLMFTVLAYNAPLTVFIGGIPVVILVGNGLGAPMAFLAGGAVILLVAFGLTTISARLRRSGGFYSFITAGLGKVVGLGAGFAAVTCYFVAIVVALAFGGIATRTLVVGLFNGPEFPWWISSIVLLCVVAVLGYLNFNLSAGVLSVFLALELLLMLAYAISVFAQGGGPDGFGFESFTAEHTFSGSIPLAIMLGVGMFGGFEATVIFRDEIRNPDRTIPRATYGVVVLMASFYALLTWVLINSYGAAVIMDIVAANVGGSASESIREYTGEFAYMLAAFLMLASCFALLLAAHSIVCRYLFNMSADGILPETLGKVHPRHKSPHRASVIVTAASFLVLALFVIFQVNEETMYARVVGVYSYVLLMILSCVSLAIAVYLYRTREKGRLRLAATSAALGFIIIFIVLILATQNFTFLSGATGGTLILLLTVIWGIAIAGGLLAIRYRKTRPEAYARIGREPS